MLKGFYMLLLIGKKTIKTAVKLAVFIVLFFKSYVVTEETYNVEITHNS